MTDLLTHVQTALAGAYRIERELEGGGMSRLFLGTDIALGRRIVVKVLPPDLASEFSAARFRREIELAAHLQHPHILPILTAGADSSLLYYVMPFVEGESLRQRLARERQLPIDDAVQILEEVADALGYAHRKGIVHRDIKPENILLEDGHAVLADFGVAGALAVSLPGERLTASGVSLGTPGYMAPEQAAGDRDVDARADVYALAVVGYEMLTGGAPFTGPTAQAVLAAHLTALPRDVGEVRPEVPRHISRAIARALAKAPDDRFPSAGAFRTALEELTSPKPRFGRGRAVAVAAGAAAFAAAAVVAWRATRTPEVRTLNPNLLAIAPFDVVDTSLSVWREGMLDVLARNLDGVDPIRTVAPTVIVRQWRDSRADASSTIALARRTGAGLALFGSLARSGGDTVRLRAYLRDVVDDLELGSVDLRDDGEHIDRLADSASIQLLRQLGDTRRIGATRLASLGSRSLPALRAFLRGEQFYRRSVMDSARIEYERALEQDPTFGLALSRLSYAIGWLRGGTDSLTLDHQLRAGSLTRGLAPRDSVLLLADSNSAAASVVPGDAETWRYAQRALMLLRGATTRYPDDPHVWFLSGDTRFHLGRFTQSTPGELLTAFERAIALDSLYGPAYIHAVELSVALRDTVKAQRLAAAFLALSHRNSESSHIGVVPPLLRGNVSVLDTISPRSAHALTQAFDYWPDSLESGVHISRAALRRAIEVGFRLPHMRHHVASSLAVRGHLRDSRAVGVVDPEFVGEMAVLDAYPADSIAEVFRSWLRSTSPDARAALGWWSARGDTASVKTLLAQQRERVRRSQDPTGRALAQEEATETELALAVTRGDTAAAAQASRATVDSLCIHSCDVVRLMKGRALAAA